MRAGRSWWDTAIIVLVGLVAVASDLVLVAADRPGVALVCGLTGVALMLLCWELTDDTRPARAADDTGQGRDTADHPGGPNTAVVTKDTGGGARARRDQMLTRARQLTTNRGLLNREYNRLIAATWPGHVGGGGR